MCDFEYNINTNKCTVVFLCRLITGYPPICFGHLVWPSSGRFMIVFSGGMDTALKVNSTCIGNYWGSSM